MASIHPRTTHRHTLLSIFTGAGGLDLGLEMAGFDTLAANEIEPHACETLRLNKQFCSIADEKELEHFIKTVLDQRCYQSLDKGSRELFVKRLRNSERRKFLQSANVIEGDIRGVDSKKFIEACGLKNQDELFCIAGGPPCQPFSRAGKRQAVDDAKNGDLFFHFVRVVKDIRPKWFIFENVKGLLLTKTDVLTIRCQSCRHTGIAPFYYRMAWGQGETHGCPCPNCKGIHTSIVANNISGGSLEIILAEFDRIGYKCYHTILNAADFGAPQLRERLFIVGSRDNTPFRWPYETHNDLRKGRDDYQLKLFRVGPDPSEQKPWNTMYDTLWSNGHPTYGALDKTKAVLWVKNVVRPHDEPVTWHLDRPSPTIGAHQGAKLAIAPYGIPEEQLFRQQWHTRGNRMSDSKPVPVVHEYLSDEELLRLQTFPPWWYLHGTRMQRAFQIGNAVPPVLAQAVGAAVIRAENKDLNQ
ncbi:MAG: DNA cytosine methyltransferase [Planctomycetes bacterium]|nr:DNA cytosine methyltransferase [Planctomycetota bacterium]